ncbi:ran-binding protein [Moniliophthora roreri MCA 2997]|uniref:Ran-binding protein n=1 Tax=Moniliophthora roreri (strain MCA 2997) TaxID=1381753 RepID=V2XZA5_MONRO|nr:ran-binding protein [Moniliophthora roreri MCA 2997]
MANRPSRSSSIPIPRNNPSTSPTRNIESVISIPFSTARQRLPSTQGPSHRPNAGAEVDPRGLGLHGSIPGGPASFSTSPVRTTVRSSTQPLPIMARPTPRTTSSFEPRVVRADSSRSFDPTCMPPATPSSSTRRPSFGNHRAASVLRTVPASSNVWTAPATSFSRPSYLEHSAFRHLLQTDGSSSSASFPSRKEEPDPRIYSGAMSPSTDSDDDSNISPPPRDIPTASTSTSAFTPSVISSDQVLKLPTRWSDQFHHPILTLSPDGRELEYQGVGSTDREAAAAARTIEPIPPVCGIYYYEVEIRSKGPKAHISIGFAGREVRTSRLPGWEPHSWGYHGDDGYSFAAEKSGSPYGPTFGLGDIIGCGIDFSTYRAFYTKNGSPLGPVFENVGKGIEIYPSVGLQLPNESVKVNFGHEPFRFDIDYHIQQQRNQAWTNLMLEPIDTAIFKRPDVLPDIGAIATVPVSAPASEEETKRELNKLVLSYLAHHGYVKTAMAFRKQSETISAPSAAVDQDIDMVDDTPGPTPAPSFEADIELRTRIVNSVLERDIDSALTETQRHYPAVLDAEQGLMVFKLRCRKFVELILDAVELKKKMDAMNLVEDGVGSDADGEVDGMSMEVDDDDDDDSVLPSGTMNGSDGIPPTRRNAKSNSATARCEAALNEAITYGQALQVDYKSDSRPEVKAIFKQTFSIVAYEDPLAAGGAVAEVAGHEARVQLANELNQAILKSQGRPTHPTLEMIYRWVAVCLLQLGLSGVGAAAFADMQRELLEA